MKRPTRVLQVFNQYLEPGGEEIWVDYMAGMRDPKIEIEDLRFYSRSWTGRGSPGFVRKALMLGDNPDSKDRLRSEVHYTSSDALVFHNLIPVGSLGLYDEARSLGLPVIQYIHNFRPFSPSGTLWYADHNQPAALFGRMLPEVIHGSWEGSRLKTALLAYHLKVALRNGLIQKVDHWIAISDFMRRKFIEAGVPEERISVLRHCWSPKMNVNETDEGDSYLFLGRLVKEKGVSQLIKAWKILEDRLGTACPKLTISGSGPLESRLRTEARGSQSITFTGFVCGEQKALLLARCRGLIVPSIWWEPLGLIVYEAFEYGRPVIAAQSGGLAENIINNRTGLLYESTDPRALAAAVEKLEAIGIGGRAEFGAAGREWLSANASPSTWLEKFRDIVDDAISKYNYT